MAEFKLGRIRFVWKKDWATGTVYYKDDVVSFAGKIYIAVIGHTSSADFYTDLDISPSKWNLVSDGQSWKGNWTPGVDYVYDDIVRYGGRLYICKTIHTSAADSTTGLEADQSKWDIFAEGLEWTGDWQTSYDYKVNDMVKYGGTTYVCITHHISAGTTSAGLEQDQAKWEVFNQGFDYKTDWTATTRYKVNDVVKFGGALWIATQYHTSSSDFTTDTANWSKFVEGVQFEDIWNYENSYQPGDIVRYGGNQYISKTDNSNSIPSTQTNDWALFSEGMRFIGDWGDDSSAYEYLVGDVVRVGSWTYRCIADHQNQQPPNTSYWQRLNTGFEWRGEWLDDREYFSGDVVRYGDNSYVCIQDHVSEGDDGSSGGGAAGSRPDLSDSGQYWSAIAIGSESSVLTTKGDLVYFSGSAPTRLPVGVDGQVLQVSANGIPEWATLASSEDVYYVAEHGVDNPAPIYGKNIDRPFKTIRYACKQIEEGTKFPDAAKLLEINRRFIQREIVEWTDYQITNENSPFVSSFDYDTIKCERDMGLIVDAAIWDMTHGGNERSRRAALKYVTEPGRFYTLDQEEETVASINYGLTVIQNVLNQTDPTNNYQALNGDNSSAVVDQDKDSDLRAEAGAYTRIAALVKIVTDAITAGDSDDIPAEDIPTTLVRVSTGTYKEILPIIVPARCCIMGDELRAVTVRPVAKETNVIYDNFDDTVPTKLDDFNYSHTALERFETVVGQVVAGEAVTKTTGNTRTQDQSWPYAQPAQHKTAVQKLARAIRQRADNRLNLKLTGDLKKAYDMDTPATGHARDLLILNKEFLAAEMVAYIDSSYSSLDYSKTKVEKNVKDMIDAIAYDLTYGGSWQSNNFALSYYTDDALNISTALQTALVAGFNNLSNEMQTALQDQAISPLQQTDVAQVRGPGGGSAQATLVANLMTEIVDVVDNGTSSITPTYPSLAGVNGDLVEASVYLNNASQDIKDQTIDFIVENFGSFKFEGNRYRDNFTKFISDSAYDMANNTNYMGVSAGRTWLSREKDIVIQNDQRIQVIGGIRQARNNARTSATEDGSSASGSSVASTRLRDSFNASIDIIADGFNAAPTLVFTSPAGVDQNRVDAKDNLVANRTFMQKDVIAYVNNTYPSLDYSEEKCERDTGFIIDALCHDILYGGTLATTRIAESYFREGTSMLYGNETETVAAYNHLKSIAGDIIKEVSVTAQSGNTEVQSTPGTPATATEETELDAKIDIITGVITAGNLNSLAAIVYPDITHADAAIEDAHSNVLSDLNDNVRNTLQYLTNQYSDFKFDHAKCSRDLGYIIDAAIYDWCLDTNYASLLAALTYLRPQSKKVTGDQKTATLAGNERARVLARANVNGVATAQQGIDDTWQIVDDTIWAGSPEGGTEAVEDIEVWNAIRMLELNKEFIVDECVAYVDDYYKIQATAASTSDNSITIPDTSYLYRNMSIKFTIETTDTLPGLIDIGITGEQEYFVRDILSATKFTVTDQLGDPAITISDDTTATFTVDKYYDYNEAACKRDLREYINGMKWDLEWSQEFKREYTEGVTLYRTGYYKTDYGSRYYANSILGSQEEDFYYLRDGTGLRLQTMDGLRGDLEAANAYGTKRPTAGAYASLDPGWGPKDERVWIKNRSPYVQNCTTFGQAATGQKIDGALHDGGNDSIVSNDFTQVISDGIGAWLLNNGRAEMVSVFTYYSHIGYLCESGGRARATNGNNSYGTFGSVAEGVDPDEVAVTGVVDNETQYQATIQTVSTDNDQLLQVEYSHAGNDYTEATIDIFGPGSGEELVADEFRDEALHRVRISDDDSVGDAGGANYTIVSNTAQAGSASSITLAATDGNLSTAYPGMVIYITGGAGIGQFGVIDTYNAGSKVATVTKPSDGTAGFDHMVPGTTLVNPNSTSTYQIEPRVTFTAAPKSTDDATITSGTFTDLDYVETAELYSNVSGTSSADGRNATFDITRVGEKYYVSVNTAGKDYARLETITIDGSSVGGEDTTNDIVITVTTINSNTNGVVDFDFTGIGRKGYYVAVSSAATFAGYYSIDGSSWTAVTNSGGTLNPTDIASGLIDDGSSTLKTSTAIITGTSGYKKSSDGITWDSAVQSYPAGFTASSSVNVAFGQISSAVGRYVIVTNGDDFAYSDNGGSNWVASTGGFGSGGQSIFAASGNKCIAYGKGRFVVLRSGSTEGAYSTDGVTWTSFTLPASRAWASVVWGNGKFLAIATDNVAGAYSLDGITWTAVTIGTDGAALPRQVAYGQGMFAVTSADTNTIAYSEDGLYWQTHTITANTGGYNAITHGNPARQSKFVYLGNGTTTAVRVSKLGVTARGRANVANNKVSAIKITEPGCCYTTAPTITVIDPNNTKDVVLTGRIDSGVLGQPTFINRGSSFTSATAEVDEQTSNGFANFFQNGAFVAVRRLTKRPVAGSNVEFDSLPGQFFKLVNTVSFVGSNDGSYTAFLQLSPEVTRADAPENGDPFEARIRFSQVRLTGHDFLDIGTGGFTTSNYPGTPLVDPDQTKETRSNNGGRVFFTATDQDGNFRVGDLFSIEQATGVATLNADAFNIAGLQELSLGEVTLGGNSASISEFSTDPFFTANSDTVVPTQRAVKAYIEAQIGGGGAQLNVNSVTAGDIFINTNQITTVSGETINIKANVNFTGSVTGLPQALAYFLR